MFQKTVLTIECVFQKTVLTIECVPEDSNHNRVCVPEDILTKIFASERENIRSKYNVKLRDRCLSQNIISVFDQGG